MTSMASLTIPQIRKAVQEEMAKQGWAQVHHLIDPVLSRLSASRMESRGTWQAGQDERIFIDRVRRELNSLAEEGILIKIGMGDRLPEGGTADRTSVTYYTPDYHARALREAETRRLARADEQARWERIAGRLAQFSITLDKDRRITADDWESLLEIAGL